MPKEIGIIDLPSDVARSVSKLDESLATIFWERYHQEKRSVGAMVALAILFPIHFFLLDNVGLGIAYWLTGGFFVIGWIVSWFLTPGWTRQYNAQRARSIISDIKLMEL